MTRRTTFPLIAAITAMMMACNPDQSGISAPSDTSPAKPLVMLRSSDALGPSKATITGTITNSVPGIPTRVVSTPSGRCHFFGWPNQTLFTGDVSGAVTFEEQVNAPCDISDIVASGPFSGDAISYGGHTGGISGEWTTNCTPDTSQPFGLSCGGVMTARGSGGLEGVHFKFVWGPGWFPFDYTGTASSN